MKKFLKIGCVLVVIGYALVMVIIGITTNESSQENEDTQKVVEEVKPWSEMSEDDKNRVINLMINAKDEPYSNHHYRIRLMITKALKQMVKYPETLEFQNMFNTKEWVDVESSKALIADSTHFKIISNETGELLISVPFRSESQVGLKVRNTLRLTLKYTGTDEFYLVDAKIE